MRRFRLTLVLSSFAFAALAGSAPAATTVGSNLAAAPTNGPAPTFSFAPTTPPTGVTTPPIVAPSAGVIVSILVKHGTSGANPGIYGFRVLSGSPTTYTTTGPSAHLPDFTWPSNDTPGTRLFTPTLAGVPKGIPIAAGNRLGLVRSSGAIAEGVTLISNDAAATGATSNNVNTVHNSGPVNYINSVNFEMLIQYRVEPDADRDGFGDETQDKCPSNAALQAACPVTAKKCKKKKRKKGKRSADAAKKKKKGGCKKKRKKK